MRNREDLHNTLKQILGSDNVYFQPPPSVQMTYPAIVYSRKRVKPLFADNKVYITQTSYSITVIDKNPDSQFVVEISKLPCCIHERHFKSDNLNHDVFTIY